jgi:dihydrofolate reductase
MSLDGFIADPQDGFELLFAWYFSGDVDVKMSTGDHEIPVKVSAESAEQIQEMGHGVGAIVSGRRMFDVSKAWGGKHPMNVPVFVVTHHIPQEWVKEGSPFTFVTDGVESAVRQAKQVAGAKSVGVGGANVAQQCLKAGLLDEVHIDLVPILLGKGIRFFEYLGIEPIKLERTNVVAAPGVTHLTFRILK